MPLSPRAVGTLKKKARPLSFFNKVKGLKEKICPLREAAKKVLLLMPLSPRAVGTLEKKARPLREEFFLRLP